MTRFEAIIPAAGLSTRMGRFKPLLPLGEGTVLSRCIDCFRENGIGRIIVVTGKRADDVSAAAVAAGAAPVHNPEFEQGMFSSVLVGVNGLPKDADAFFILPADIPLVRTETVARLMEEFDRTRPSVLYPRYRGERGHPPVISRELLPDILSHDGSGGLRVVLDRFDGSALDLDVADFGTVHDLDHPEDYKLAQAHSERQYPTPEECEELWQIHSVHGHIVGHCTAVARVAVALCGAMNSNGCGCRLDPALARGAALTHDIGKGTKRHEAAGAEWLESHGFPAAADIVRDHFDVSLAPDQPITEKQLVFLADKLVRCHSPVPLEGRYMEKVRMYAHEPGAKEAILGRLERARALMERFDRETGDSAEKLACAALA